MTRPCSTPGCGRAHLARGLCRRCYDKARGPQERRSYGTRWAKAHPDRVREIARQTYHRHRLKRLQRLKERRRARGALSREEDLERRRAASFSGYIGVTFHRLSGLWHASITRNGREISLKYHKTKEAAARAYDEKARELFGPAARLNFPDAPA